MKALIYPDVNSCATDSKALSPIIKSVNCQADVANDFGSGPPVLKRNENYRTRFEPLAILPEYSLVIGDWLVLVESAVIMLVLLLWFKWGLILTARYKKKSDIRKA